MSNSVNTTETVVEGFINDAMENNDLIDNYKANVLAVDADVIEEGRAAIASFLKRSTCYDLIPESGRVVVFDENIPIRLAYYAMVEQGSNEEVVNDIGHLATPVWNSNEQKLSGIITVRDIIHILKYGYKTNSIKDIMDKHSIATWWAIIRKLKATPDIAKSLETQDIPGVKAALMAAQAEFSDEKARGERLGVAKAKNDVLLVGPDDSLYEACSLLRYHAVRWIPVMDGESKTCLGVVTNLVVLKYLVQQFREERRLFDQPIRDLGIGTFRSSKKEVISVKLDTLLCDVIDILVDNKISCVPIVDDDGRPIEVYSTTNATTPIAKSSIDMCMTMPVSHFLFTESTSGESTHTDRVRMGRRSEFYTCLATDTLHEVFVQFADTQVPRLIVVDENGILDGVVSLSDLLPYFLDNRKEDQD